MSDIAIRVEQLSKRYRIGQGRSPRYDTLRDRIAGAIAAPLRGLSSAARRANAGSRLGTNGPEDDYLWALREVSLEIKRGEIVGIIGRNGAGKSTLLKILSRISQPTEGFAEIYGRVGSLLEVGTGFHPELTGRENIYLNGALLGMKKAEIGRKLDAIVAFAEIERFIDTPVKFYSSGMYVRLAFAVAAHLEPEILLVDEVLAVGDAAFQKKCLGKMGAVAKEGRTVVFVSHDMTNISVLCPTALLFESGQIALRGMSTTVIEHYLDQRTDGRSEASWELEQAPGDELAKIMGVRVCTQDRVSAHSFALTEPILLVIDYLILRDQVRVNPVFVVKNSMNITVFSTSNFEDPVWGARPSASGHYRAHCLVPAHLLNEGHYVVSALVVHETRLVRASAEEVVGFSVYDNGATRGDYVGEWTGIVRPRCHWSTAELYHEELHVYDP